jgi:predicted nucleotidyltransferase
MGEKFDYQGAVRFQKERRNKRRETLSLKLEEARRDFAAITTMIIEKYKPAAVYQWGSLIDGSHFSEISDIDIAVEGIRTADKYFALLGDAMVMTEFPLDIVQLEKIDPEFRKQIMIRGKLVYERH